MPKIDKTAQRVKDIFNKSRLNSRSQWEYVNQKGYDFSNDNQLSNQERIALEEQGMPTFTINRIMPVVEMLNFYATAQQPRWQAVGAEGSDIDVAAVFSDMADFIWYNSDGSSLYANAINDSITKSIGYLMVSVDQDQDNGMGEVVIQNPEPFDVFVDPKSRDMMFKDAAYILIKKILPKNHLMKLYPDHKAKIKKVSANEDHEDYYTEKSLDNLQKDFTYKDIDSSDTVDPATGEHEELVDFYELYEKVRVAYMNVFYRTPPNKEVLEAIAQQVQVKLQEMQKEMEVRLMEQQAQMQEAVQKGDMLPARFELEMEKAQKMMQQQLQVAQQEFQSQLVAEQSKVENVIVSEKEFKAMMKSKTFAASLMEAVKFYGNRIKQTIVVGDKSLYTRVLPERITDFPLVPFHFKWTGTPYPISAVSPLMGKQMELNKAHQIMVHNASLGSSLRWMHEEGSIDTDHWEQYSSSPGALLPIRPGSTPPTPVMPAPLSNAFFGIVQEGKQDMEYLAGIYGAMQGDTSAQHDTYRGMLAMDEYGTRRVKQWMKNSIEPALKQLGMLVMQYSQSLYTANKVFRVVQPSSLQGEQEQEINIPMYNDLGQAIGKFKDYSAAKFDIRIIAGSTLPVNRWAYLDELKQLLQLGVVDDIAVLSETDVRNKEKIAKRKSMYSQMQGQIQNMEEGLKDKEGTIETLERQLVQAGIKNKVMQAAIEINKEKEEVKGKLKEEAVKGASTIKEIQATAKGKMDREQQEKSLQFKAALEGMKLAEEKDQLERDKKDLQETKEVS
jgi:hypothetical protein